MNRLGWPFVALRGWLTAGTACGDIAFGIWVDRCILPCMMHLVIPGPTRGTTSSDHCAWQRWGSSPIASHTTSRSTSHTTSHATINFQCAGLVWSRSGWLVVALWGRLAACTASTGDSAWPTACKSFPSERPFLACMFFVNL